MRGTTEQRQRRPPCPVPLVTSGLRSPPQERECPQGQGRGSLPLGKLQRTVPHPRRQLLLAVQPPEAADALAEGALRRGRETAGATSGGRREVPHPAQVSASGDDLGRRGDELLLQGEVKVYSEGLLPTESLPIAEGEESAVRCYGPNDDPGQQLVQEPTTEGQSERSKRHQ